MYVSKSEEPDSKLMCNILAKSLSHPGMNPTRRDIFRKTVTAMLSSTVVGATQAVWSLMNFDFVRKTRKVIHVSTLPRARIAQKFLNLKQLKTKAAEDGPEASAFEEPSAYSHLGRRNAYSAFLDKQNELLQTRSLVDERQDEADELDDKIEESHLKDVSFHALLTGYNITNVPTPGATPIG